MPEMLNPFEADAFSMVSLTRNINKYPNMYSRIQEMGLFGVEPIATRTVVFEWYEGVLNLLKNQPLGAPGMLNVTGKRKIESIPVPHYPLDDVITPEEYAGIREFGSASQMATAATVLARKLLEMNNKHDITLEYLMLGALKGFVIDGDGSTILANLFAKFDVSQKTVFFDLGNSSADMESKANEVTTHIRTNLKGEMMTGVHALVSRTFLNSLKAHASVIEWRQMNREAQLSLLNERDNSRFFAFAGILFEQYDAAAPLTVGAAATDFITSGEGHAFPLGTTDTFKLYLAPADFIETANTLGLRRYAKQEPRKFNRGTDIHTQSNPLPVCRRPEVLVKLDDGAGTS